MATSPRISDGTRMRSTSRNGKVGEIAAMSSVPKAAPLARIVASFALQSLASSLVYLLRRWMLSTTRMGGRAVVCISAVSGQRRSADLVDGIVVACVADVLETE